MEQDLDAIRRCLEGDTDSFRALVERYEHEAITHARAIVGSREDSLELVQDSFLDAFRALSGFQLGREFYPWFYVILRNRCYGWLKSRSKRATINLEASGDLIIASESSDVAEDIEEALLKINGEDREIILLKYVDGLTYRCIAERLEIPIGTVMSRLYHARRRLRETLESSTN